ncbi:MAG: DNA gyrase subunit A [Clostridiales bacterium]|nr:DNA gyrase subunit A [Clostridiales bacterium]
MEFNFDNQTIKPISIEDEMKKSFISYAMATIVSRALPDVRDGLKPVHRRILYSMHELGITPDKPHKKSVRIVGDVLGKFHPHGDTAVYDAMVRMAQDFSTRALLVDGHGNFGSVDGDGAAAMRYTEARMSKIALEMLRDIDKDTVNFVPNFDESQMQPSVLPARYPNLLVNGSSGIAVGMATNIPPHNLGEVVNATIAMIDDPDISVIDLMQHIKGPDFPTGALIMGSGGIIEAYETGRGKVIMRGESEIEEMANGKSRIIITSLPYQVNKSRLIEKMADLVNQRRIEGITDLRDESDRTGMRIVVELKRDANSNIILNQLYKHTQLQDTFGINMLALVDDEPKVLGLKQVLGYYITHQREVVTRRTKFEFDRAQKRAHIVEGLLKALDYIDEVIKLIRASKNDAEAKSGLMEKFELSEVQAQAILDMRLRRLTGLEKTRLLDEYTKLKETMAYLSSILEDDEKLMQVIKDELTGVSEKYADDRRTEMRVDYSDIDMEDLIQEEEMVVTITHFGYIKRLTSATYRQQNRGGVGIKGLSARDEDFVEKILVTSTHDWLYFFTDMGRVHRLKCWQIPEASRTARGTAIVNLLQLDGGEKITTVIPFEKDVDIEGKFLVLATRKGVIKKTPLEEYQNLRNVGLRAINLVDDDKLISAVLTDGSYDIYMGTRNGMAIRFSENDVRPMHRVVTGVRGIKLREGDVAVDMGLVDERIKLLAISEQGYGKRTDFVEYRQQNRGGFGVITMNINQKTGKLVDLKPCTDEEDVMLISSDGTIIRMSIDSISKMGRSTQGVKVMKLRENDTVVAAEVVSPDDVEAIETDEIITETE